MGVGWRSGTLDASKIWNRRNQTAETESQCFRLPSMSKFTATDIWDRMDYKGRREERSQWYRLRRALRPRPETFETTTMYGISTGGSLKTQPTNPQRGSRTYDSTSLHHIHPRTDKAAEIYAKRDWYTYAYENHSSTHPHWIWPAPKHA
jgi:hypothetical protein